MTPVPKKRDTLASTRKISGMPAGYQKDGAMRQVPSEKRSQKAARDKEDPRISWTEENAAAIAERRSWIRAKGAPLADLQVLKLD
jgi:hypothetical protein